MANHRTALLAAVLTATCTACGPLEPGDELADGPSAPLARSSDGGGGGSAVRAIVLPSGALEAGSVVTGTVTAGDGVRVYLSYPKTLFAGPGWVKIPSGQSSATFTLHVSPYVSASTTATVSARTTTPDAAGFVSRTVTVAPAAVLPEFRAQVASATFSSTTLLTGTTATGTLTLTAPAPAAGAAVLVVISNDFLGLDADVPPVVVVPPGATSATFPIRAHLSSPLLGSATENVVANLFGGSFQGGSLLITR